MDTYEVAEFLLDNKINLQTRVMTHLLNDPILSDETMDDILEDLIYQYLIGEIALNFGLHVDTVYSIIDKEFVNKVLGKGFLKGE